MSWAALITLLLQFFGPILAKFLEDLLNRAAERMAAPPMSYAGASGLERLFDAAADELSWWQFRKKAVLAVCRRQATAHADAFFAAAKFGSSFAPVMSPAEAVELRDACGL